jgi:predicted TIM-barrel fold metal-dependent hydrolase
MYAADWPVFNLAKDCGVDKVFEIIDVIVKKNFDGNKEIWNDIFHNNAIRIYNLQ